MTDTPEVVAARIEVERTRGKLIGTAHALQERLSPRTLASNAWEGAKVKGADLAEDAVDAVKARPLTTSGVVAAFAMFLARQPLMDLAAKLFTKDGERKRTPSKAKKNMETVNEPAD